MASFLKDAIALLAVVASLATFAAGYISLAEVAGAVVVIFATHFIFRVHSEEPV